MTSVQRTNLEFLFPEIIERELLPTSESGDDALFRLAWDTEVLILKKANQIRFRRRG